MKIIFLIILFLLPPNVIAQICDENLKPIDNSELGYKNRNTRCEGLYKSKISASDYFEIVNLTVDTLDYNLSKTDTIIIEPKIDLDVLLTIQAKAIPIRTYYRMDAEIRKNSKLIWPVGDVLYKSQFTPNKIGITGWYKHTDYGKVYIPLKFKSLEKPRIEDQVIYAVLRNNIDFVSVQYRIFSDATNTYTDWKEIFDSSVPAGTRISLPLNNLPLGWHILYLAGYNNGSNWKQEKFYFRKLVQ